MRRNKISENLGKYFKSLREQHGYSLKDIENHTGVSASYINKMEIGKKVSPTLPVLYSLSKFYGTSIFDIVAIALEIDIENEKKLAKNVLFNNENYLKIRDDKSKEIMEEIVGFILTIDWSEEKRFQHILKLAEKIDKFKRNNSNMYLDIFDNIKK